MERPWMKFHTRDWLDNKELRRCSPMARAILADLMCLAHEGVPYGHLADKIGPLSNEYMAARCVVRLPVFLKAVIELQSYHRVARDATLFIPRMVADEDLRLRHAAVQRPPDRPPQRPPVPPNSGDLDSRARTRADSDSGSNSSASEVLLDFAPEKHRNGKRTTDQIKAALGERLPWWEMWWKLYPCHEDMRQAIDAFERKVTSEETAERAINGAERYRRQYEADPTMKLKYGQGWLNDERWTDENKMAPAKQKMGVAESVEHYVLQRIAEGRSPL